MALMLIKERREACGLSQVKLGSYMGVAQNVVSTWETEVALPRTRDLPRLAHVLGCSIDELFTDEAKDLEEAVG